MQGFAKRGLALVAATSGLVMATAGIASADATATGSSSHSGGFASGNVANTATSIPVNVCGNQANALAFQNTVYGQFCEIGSGQGSSAIGTSDHSGGFASGNVANSAVSTPLNTCGDQADGTAALDQVQSSDCSIGTNGDAAGSSAFGASDHSGGFGSGNVVNTAVSTPLNLCGNQADAVAFEDSVQGSGCSIG